MDVTPRWGTMAIAMVVAALLTLPLLREGAGLYWYAFPLFGVGVAYVLQYRSRISRFWWAVFVAITPLSAVALALEWAFSGHVLWNVLFLGHNALVVRSRPWRWVLVASLVHLVVLKALFQTSRDLAGAGLSGGIAVAVVVWAWRRRTV